MNEPIELQKTDKDLIREVIREEKEEEVGREQRKLNLIIHLMPESDKGTLEDRKQDDCEKVQAILMDTLNLDVDIGNVFRLGVLSRDRRKARPIRFSVSSE